MRPPIVAMIDWITGESAAKAPLGRPKPAEAAATRKWYVVDASGKTVGRLANGHYVEVSGNHMTMLFGSHADAVVAAMEGFLG